MTSSGIIQETLKRLTIEQHAFALEALKRPGDKSEFEFGFRSGKVAGYDAALSIINNLIKEADSDDNKL